MENKEKQSFQLSAIDQVVVDNIPSSKESKIRNKLPIYWGPENLYPEYLWELYNSVATLQSVINGTVDFICGNNATAMYFPNGIVNEAGDTVEDLLRKVALDKMIFGGFAIEIIRSMDGRIKSLNHIDFLRLRSNDKNTEFYYSNDWSAWSAKYIIIPKFDPDKPTARSIYYNKGYVTRTVYPTPIYGAAVIPCEIEKCINEFHLNNINNGFMSNLIISFNNGTPNDEQKAEIERKLQEKFGGYQNAGRVIITYNDTADNKVTVERLDGDDFDQKYTALSERSRQQIFTAFRAHPNLFGIPTETTGFSSQEYEEAFRLYNRTTVAPIQNEIVDAFDKILGVKDSLTIVPFSLDYNKEQIIS